MPGENWRSVYGYGALLVECKGCARRGAIDKEGARRQMHQGNMREINRDKFSCRKCGGTEVRVSADHKGSGRDVPGRRSGRHDAASNLIPLY